MDAIVEGIARLVDDPLIDLSSLTHDRSSRADLGALSVLAWWMLSTESLPSDLRLNLPKQKSAVWPLLRSGLLFAAARRSIPTLLEGVPFSLSDYSANPSEVRLPNQNWAVYDDPVDLGTLRAIPDLEDPRRKVPPARPYRYAWAYALQVASYLSPADRSSLFADIDAILGEVAENVENWAQATRAVLVCSVTRGGGDESWDRVHIVVMDNGLGIPRARSLQDGGRWKLDLQGREEDVTAALLDALINSRYGARGLPGHLGAGLNVVSTLAGSWRGSMRVCTVEDDSGYQPPVLMSSSTHMVGREAQRLALPGARGTLVHVQFDVTPLPSMGDPGTGQQLDGAQALSV